MPNSLADDLLDLARRLNDPGLALQAHQALGMTAFCRGDAERGLRHVEQVAALYDPERHRRTLVVFGQDPGVICKAFGAVVLWLLGHEDAAVREAEAVDMSAGLTPSCQAVAAVLRRHAQPDARRRPERRRAAEACRRSAPSTTRVLAGRAARCSPAGPLAADGQLAEGIEQLRRGLLAWQATGSITYRTYYLGLLAEALNRANQTAEAAQLLDEAIPLVDHTGEGLWAPELHRLRGAILLDQSGNDHAATEAAHAELLAARDLARAQHSRSLERRAEAAIAAAGLRPDS